MALIGANELKKKMLIEVEGQPFNVLDVFFATPTARGASTMVRTRLKNLLNGAVLEKTFRTSEKFPEPDVELAGVSFLYSDGDGFHFMNMENYEQVAATADVIGDQAAYLQPEMKVKLSVHEGTVVAIELPQRMTLEITDTEPTMKGQTASSSYKPALLSNGVRTLVPGHIVPGTRIVVMTQDGSYAERAKD